MSAPEPVKTQLDEREQIAYSRPSDLQSADKGLQANRNKRAWGVTPQVFVNQHFKPLTVDVALMTFVIAFNKSSAAKDFYGWMNATYSPFQIKCWGLLIITTAVYWIYGLLYAFMDLTGKPGFLFRYKIQPYKRVTLKEYLNIGLIVLRNQLFVSMPLTYAFACIPNMGDTSYEGLPGARWTIFTYCFCLLCEELGFFYVHRALHHPSRYARFHKKHHLFTAPVALAATYATMVEHALSNLFPIILGHIILGSHWSMVVYFFCSLTMGTLDTHSGYNTPFLHNALRHDWHHFSFNENFGPTGLMDSFYGSSVKFNTALKDAIALKGSRKAGEAHLAHKMAMASLDD